MKKLSRNEAKRIKEMGDMAMFVARKDGNTRFCGYCKKESITYSHPSKFKCQHCINKRIDK